MNAQWHKRQRFLQFFIGANMIRMTMGVDNISDDKALLANIIEKFLSICPTNWGLTAPKAMEWLRENMMPYYPVKQFKCPEEVKEVK